MASNELIIDDDYCRAMGDYFVKQGEQLDTLVSDYITILQDIENKAIISGDVSKALSIYIDYVKQLNKKVGAISEAIKTQIGSFLERVDSEDQYLF